MADENRWCFAWMKLPPGSDTTQSKAALMKAAQWRPGDRITVKFLDGDPIVQRKVKKVALGWTVPGLADLTLVFLRKTAKTRADIRISFKFDGSWSIVGTGCRQEPDQTAPTMNYGWLDRNSSEDEIRRVVLHEFGHALGLIHEHQNPTGSIKWNRDAVIRDLSGPPNSWSLAEIENNIFQMPSASEVSSTPVDAKSIMMYPFPATWTLDGFHTGLNSELSETDKRFIRQMYP